MSRSNVVGWGVVAILCAALAGGCIEGPGVTNPEGDAGTDGGTRNTSDAGTFEPLTIVTTSLPAATVDIDYQAPLTAKGGSGGYVWSISSRSGLAWLSLGASGQFSGVPKSIESGNVTIAVSDSNHAQSMVTFSLQVTTCTSGVSYPCAAPDADAACREGHKLCGDSGVFGACVPDGAVTSTEAQCGVDLAHPEACGQCDERNNCEGGKCSCGGTVCSGTPATNDCCTNDAGGFSCVDTATDVRHCGDCSHPCPDRTGASKTCSGRNCAYACTGTMRNCSSPDATTTLTTTSEADGNGCESDFASDATCGACDINCKAVGAAQHVAASICGSTQKCELTCAPDWQNCTSDWRNGCMTDLTATATCGSCANDCNAIKADPSKHVVAVACGSAKTCSIPAGGCAAGWGDCDGDFSNGCEVNLNTSDANCGQCGTVCAATRTCGGGLCCKACSDGMTECCGTQSCKFDGSGYYCG